MPNPETSMSIRRKKTKGLRRERTEMHKPRHEIGKEQKQSSFEKDDPTVNLNSFCGATLLRRREKSFEHDASLVGHSKRS